MKTNEDTTLYTCLLHINKFENRACCLLYLYRCPPTPSTQLSSLLLSSFWGRMWADSWPFAAHPSHINTHSLVRRYAPAAWASEPGDSQKALALTWCPHLKVSLLWPQWYQYGRCSRCWEVDSFCQQEGESDRYPVMPRRREYSKTLQQDMQTCCPRSAQHHIRHILPLDLATLRKVRDLLAQLTATKSLPFQF